MPEVNGAKLKAIRISRGMSLKDLEEATGVKTRTLIRIENGDTPNPGVVTLTLITKALLIDLEEVLINSKDEG